MSKTRNSSATDLDRLSRFEALSLLSNPQKFLLTNALAFSDFKRSRLIFRQAALASDVHVLLKGIVRVTCRNASGQRVTVALLPPGPMPMFPSLALGRFDFHCEAYNDCRVGSLSWDDFNSIIGDVAMTIRGRLHEHDLQQWYRLLLRSSGFLNLDLHERIAITLLELASDFGIKELRGTLLRTSFSHQDIADLVGASRPRVTEHLARLDREHLLIRQGRQLIVRVDEIGDAISIWSSTEFGSAANPPSKSFR